VVVACSSDRGDGGDGKSTTTPAISTRENTAQNAPVVDAPASMKTSPRFSTDDPKARLYQRMSAMGALAAGVALSRDDDALPIGKLGPLPEIAGGPDTQVDSVGGLGFQSETTIAAKPDASVLIAGYNDSNGFPTGTITAGVTPLSISGVARSTDGGRTWTEVLVGPGGQGTIPCGANGELYGDPDVKYDPTRDVFIYSSILVRGGDGLQGMAINTSDSTGSVWSNPIQVTPSFVANDSADKEFIDVNRATGRVAVSWTMFNSISGVGSILTTHSDDLGTTWSPAATLQAGTATTGVQGSVPRFLPGTTNANSSAYVVWSNDSVVGTTTTDNVGCSRSTDGGTTWSAAVNLDATGFPDADLIQGMDRVDSFPAMAIDYTSGRVYVVYERGNAQGTGEIALRTFTGTCQTGAAVLLNTSPGNDRAQSHPFVSVDQTTRRVHVGWYDQGIDASGDRLEVMHTYSDDQGTTWSPPSPITDRPFHAGYGNDTTQPNLGDYNQSTAVNGQLYTMFGGTSVAPLFSEGEPGSGSMITPDAYSDDTADTQKIAPLRIASTSISDAAFCASGSNNNADPGETVDLDVNVTNYVGNPAVSATTVTNIQATLTTTTPGVTILQPTATYANLAALGTEKGQKPFGFSVSSTFVPGVWIDFVLKLTTSQGATELPFRIATGTDGTPTSLMNESWTTSTITASQAPPTTTNWYSVRGGTTSAVRTPWAVNQNLTPGNNAAFHSDTAGYGWIRLWSPYVAIPTPVDQSNVTLDFDLVYNLEDEPTKTVQAYDGMTVRITDQTTGATVRSVLAEAFATQILTGNSLHFPKHLVRDNNTAYFEDMSVWSGNSNGPVHVAMRFPGNGMVGRTVQLRFEYAQDNANVCASGTCGVAIDNIVMNMVPVISAACTPKPPVCGDGIIESGEQCDDGGTSTGCCSATCQFNSSTTVCGPGTSSCSAAYCDGAGTCLAPTSVPNGTTCNDGIACTKNDVCTAGACGGTSYTCTPTSCQSSSTCDDLGGCTIVNKGSGSACPDDGNACTSDACDGAGTCAHPNVPDGTSCASGQVCSAGSCVADCFIAGTLYPSGVMNPANACQVCTPSSSTTAWSSVTDGTTCNDGNACTKSDACQAGVCSGNAVTCTASDACHAVGACDPTTGACTNPTMPDGTMCSDGNLCTQTDTCQTGVCTGASPVQCIAQDECHDVGTCDQTNGTCSNPTKADGTPCSGGTCQGGTCTPDMIDAGTDSGTDSGTVGMDAGVDAADIDAALVDASTSDASVADASVGDASGMDASSTDGGAMIDAAMSDAGNSDAGMTSNDAGTQTDSGMMSNDAGTQTDSGMMGDGGGADAAAPKKDAGHPSTDGAADNDASTSDQGSADESGCGCRTVRSQNVSSPALIGLGVLAFVGALRVRRRRRG
jgi:hypothetical protein